MRKPIYRLVLLTFLAASCIRQEKPVEECENFQVLGFFYQGERVWVTVNSKLLHIESFAERTRPVLRRFCLAYTDTFTVQVRITRADKIMLDTAMVGYAQQGPYLLVVPLGKPRQPMETQGLSEEQKVALFAKIYDKTPKDSLIRTAFLEPGVL